VNGGIRGSAQLRFAAQVQACGLTGASTCCARFRFCLRSATTTATSRKTATISPPIWDNFFFPDNRPARWYTFSYANLAQFVALDSTENTIAGPPSPVFAPGGEQAKWLGRVLAESHAPWKIPYSHHPPFNAGPGHGAALGMLRHWVDLFRNNGVRAVFSGHEHNFQFSEDSDATGHVRYFVTGSGIQLRPGDVRPNMRSAYIEGWSPLYEFLVVEIEGGAMHVTPLGSVPVVVRDANGKPIPMPAAIQLPQ
jgi:hypothetical protein